MLCFSRSEKGSDGNVEFVNEDVVEFTKRLKAQEGSKIWMVGGGELLREFFKNNLIDEYVVTITPHILGSSSVISRQEPEINLTLMDTKRFGQFVNLYYSSDKKHDY